MSYDLYFVRPKISRADFISYFSQRQCYKINNDQAFYENELTEVYFSFDYLDKDNTEFQEDKDDEIDATLSFNINYFRPHVFAIEASEEINLLIKEFNFKILDLQNYGMGNGPFEKQKFLDVWNIGNEMAIKFLLKSNKKEKATVFTKDTTAIEKCWKWNFERDNRYEIIQNHIFIPRFLYITVNKNLCTMVVWTDGIPVLLPKADYVLLMKNDLLVNKQLDSQFEKCLVPFKMVEHILEIYPKTSRFGLESYELFYKEAPISIIDFFKRAKSNTEFSRIPLEDVLNKELIEKCM